MRVLGIDPGTYRMGVGVIDAERGGLALVHHEVIEPRRNDPIATRLHALLTRLNAMIEELRPTSVAIEQPFAGENKRTALAIGHAQAVAMVAAAGHGLGVSSYPPRQVKQAVTDYGGSSKEQVQQMVAVLLEMDEAPPSFDASDALAVAICHVNASEVNELAIID